MHTQERHDWGRRFGLLGDEATKRATVLLVLNSEAVRAKRRRKRRKMIDPVLCLSEGCYVSNGTHTSARFLHGRRAFGLGNVMGRRAGACRNQRTCVYRDIAINYGGISLQPVDINVVRHDRYGWSAAKPDATCRIENARLKCGRGITTDAYRMWIIPEAVARSAGPELLAEALASLTDGTSGRVTRRFR